MTTRRLVQIATCLLSILALPVGGGGPALGEPAPRHLGRGAGTPQVSTLALDAELPSRGRLGGLSVDAAGNLYVSNFGAAVWRIDGSGHVERLAVELRGSSGNAVDAAGNLYQASFVDGRIVKVSPDGKAEDWVTTGLAGPVGIAVGADGTLYVCNCKGGFIARVAPDRSVERWSSSPDFDCPNGITLDRDGAPVVVSYNNGYVVRIGADGTARRIASLDGRGAHVAATDDALYVTQIADHRIVRLGLDGAVETVAGSGQSGLDDGPAAQATLAHPNGIALGPDGTTLFFDDLDGVWRGDDATRIVVRRLSLGTTL